MNVSEEKIRNEGILLYNGYKGVKSIENGYYYMDRMIYKGIMTHNDTHLLGTYPTYNIFRQCTTFITPEQIKLLDDCSNEHLSYDKRAALQKAYKVIFGEEEEITNSDKVDLVFVKYTNGNAYYSIEWPVRQAAQNNFLSKKSTALSIKHIISGTYYSSNYEKLERVSWTDIPLDYAYDAWNNNEQLRKKVSKPIKIGNNEESISSNELKQLKEDYNSLKEDYKELEIEVADLLKKDQIKDKFIQELHKKLQVERNNSIHWKNIVTSTSDSAKMELEVDDKYSWSRTCENKSVITEVINEQTKTNNMNFGNMIPNFKFGKLESTNMIALSMAGIAFRKNDSYVVFNKDTRQIIEVGDMKMDVDFYQIPVQTLATGDVTIIDNQFLIVDHVNDSDGSISCIHPTSGTKTTKLARTNIFNMYFYTKIVSMFDFMGNITGQVANTASPFGAINPMMFMMMGDKEGKSGGMNGMMEMMMMSQMFSGGNNLFGNTTPVVKAEPKKVIVKKTPTKSTRTTVKEPKKK